jgi:hypothetical protein
VGAGIAACIEGTRDGCAACGLYILSHGASFASIIAMVPQFRCFGGAAGGCAPAAVLSSMAVAAGFGMENVAVFILSVKAAADLRQSAGRTLDAQV